MLYIPTQCLKDIWIKSRNKEEKVLSKMIESVRKIHDLSQMFVRLETNLKWTKGRRMREFVVKKTLSKIAYEKNGYEKIGY
jgi:hypothetical protein